MDLWFPCIFILYSELLHLPYKIELMNFGVRIVGNAYAHLLAVFTMFIAKLNRLILFLALREELLLLHYYFDEEGGHDPVVVLQGRWYLHSKRRLCCDGSIKLGILMAVEVYEAREAVLLAKAQMAPGAGAGAVHWSIGNLCALGERGAVAGVVHWSIGCYCIVFVFDSLINKYTPCILLAYHLVSYLRGGVEIMFRTRYCLVFCIVLQHRICNY